MPRFDEAEQEAKRAAFDAGASTWVSWNNVQYTTTASTTTTVMNAVTWSTWNSVCMTSGNTVTGQPQWTDWNAAYEEAGELSAEQQAERDAAQAERRRQQDEREEEWRQRAAEQKRERETASARARELLRVLLSDAQWARYEENGWFEVRGSKGGRWRIRDNGQSGNVDLMPEIGDERDVTYCAHPPGSLPDADAHAAQMLTLVTDEDAFVRTANVHYRRPAPGGLRAVA